MRDFRVGLVCVLKSKVLGVPLSNDKESNLDLLVFVCLALASRASEQPGRNSRWANDFRVAG